MQKQRYAMIETYKIMPNPLQPRRNFDPDKLRTLADSISRNGLIQPISVRKTQLGYVLIAGERRLRASKLAGIGKIPCVLVDTDDVGSGVMAMLENLQREDLNFFEEAEGIRSLIEHGGLSQVEAGRLLGKTQPTIANKLRLLLLDQTVRSTILTAGLTERHARALLCVEPEHRPKVLRQIIERELNVGQTEELIDRLNAEHPKRVIRGAPKDLRLFNNSIKHAVTSLNKCGIESRFSMSEFDDRVEYLIWVKKS